MIQGDRIKTKKQNQNQNSILKARKVSNCAPLDGLSDLPNRGRKKANILTTIPIISNTV